MQKIEMIKNSFIIILSFFVLLGCLKQEQFYQFPDLDFYFATSKEEVNFKVNKPWEKLGLGYINVIKTDSVWHMWYESFGEESRQMGRIDYNGYLNYAYSNDGINWKKPELGITSFNGSKDNNIIASNNGKKNNSIHGVTVFVDSLAPKEERFKMVYTRWIEEKKMNWIYGMVSSDGIHWREERLLLKHYSDTQTVCYREDGQFKLYYRYWSGKEQGMGYRQIGYAVSSSFDKQFRKMGSVDFEHFANSNQIHLYNSSARSVNDSLTVLFPSIYKPKEDKMHIKVAYNVPYNNKVFSFHEFEEKYRIERSERYNVIYVAPQSINISKEGNSFWVYFSAKSAGHGSWQNSDITYPGDIGRTLVTIVNN